MIVLKGQVILSLDDSTQLPVAEGIVVVQQVSMHGWDNETDEWTRLMGSMIPMQPPVYNGMELENFRPF